MNMMTEKCKTYGVEVLTKHKIVDVEVKDGKVVAAVAKSDAGHVRVACKACVLATGSWISNEEVVKKYAPDYYQATRHMEEIRNNLKGNSAAFITADTLEGLADKIGVDKKNFLETVKKYNEGCKTGIDAFFKNKAHLAPISKAPFYAIKGNFGTDGAFGGVRVNPEMQAYRADRNSLVEGLYVTGDFASGKHVNVNGVKWQVLNDLSWAFSSGFLAGTNAARYLTKV